MPFSAGIFRKMMWVISMTCAFTSGASAKENAEQKSRNVHPFPESDRHTAAAHKPPAIIYEIGLELWGAAGARSLVTTPVNPTNQVAQIPQKQLTTEARPDFKFTMKKAKITVRPRGILTMNRTEAGGSTLNKTTGKLRWSEAFGSLQIADPISITYGLQNFQWGPAEAASPSNRIFRDTIEAKDVLYVTRGKHLFRMNITPSQGWSEVLLVELTSNGSSEYEAQEKFARKAILKSEISWAGGADYLGVIAGWRNKSGVYAGEYFNADVLDGLSVYTDIAHQRGSLAYYPDSSSGLTLLTQTKKTDQRIYTFATTGARYAFENGNDWRVEYIFHEQGYNKTQVISVWNALASNVPQQQQFFALNASLAFQNGLEFPGKHYLFSSIRFPNAFSVKDWTIYLRDLYSLQDGSNSAFLSSEIAIGQRGTFFGSVSASAGKLESELRGLIAYSGVLGYRHAW
jgi:hypothetical protein